MYRTIVTFTLTLIFLLLFQEGCKKNNPIPRDITNRSQNSWSNSLKDTSKTSTLTYAGKTYHTIQIGKQCWLKENLDIGTMIDENERQSLNNIVEKHCYHNDTANCRKYGGLYEWDEAMQYSITEGTQGICPSGWHIPTLAEFQTLREAVNNDGNALKEGGQGVGDGVGTNTSGFSALLAGSTNYSGTYVFGEHAIFWSSTHQFNDKYSFSLGLFNTIDDIGLYGSPERAGVSIRCLKN